MKRFFPWLILLILLSGCSSLPHQKEESLSEIRTALREVVLSASERVEANIHSQMSLISMIPPSSSPLLDQKQIPRLEEHLQVWTRQVIAAFRQATIAMPQLLRPYIEKLEITDPLAVMQRSDSSATALLMENYQEDIEREIQVMLAGYLVPSMQTWEILTDRYAIWSRSKALLGEETLPILGPGPLDHLIRIFFSAYLEELTREELYLRTTPVFQGTGSFYEILNKKV